MKGSFGVRATGTSPAAPEGTALGALDSILLSRPGAAPDGACAALRVRVLSSPCKKRQAPGSAEACGMKGSFLGARDRNKRLVRPQGRPLRALGQHNRFESCQARAKNDKPPTCGGLWHEGKFLVRATGLEPVTPTV